MRLLECGPDGGFTVTENLPCNEDLEYAILSHTWGSEEVAFEDLVHGTGGNKYGYKKLRFCANQARQNGLRYFWVDTCCIDKSNHVELNEAIISMFRWYRKAVSCYVYLSDVLAAGWGREQKRKHSESWEEAFRVSRWFTRGWTLQELLAPASVEFFTPDGQRLGDKKSLEQTIHEITEIATSALRSTDLSQFDVRERFQWAETRQTTREEDWAYCLLGIFDVSMSALYGEGKEKAIRRLKEKIRANYVSQNCHYIPLPENNRFVGRRIILNDLRQKLFGGTPTRTVAVVGLGGIGKTQVALQVAYWAKKNQPQYSILWVPALSTATFEHAYTEIAKKLGIRLADDEDIKEAVQQYLSSDKAGPWLLILDNADDLALVLGDPDKRGIVDYLPQSEYGVVLLTTRLAEVAESVAGVDVVELGDMDHKEALNLLGNLVRRADVLSDEIATAELLRELAHLPLAITQAAAYLNRHKIPVTEYIQLLRGTEQDIIRLLSREFHDNGRYRGTGNAVATTWLVSFDQIRRSDTAAAELLMFISCIEPKAIPRSILPNIESEEEMVRALGTLFSYAFLSKRENGDTYDMHSLVHLATQVWMQNHKLGEDAAGNAMRHVNKLFPTDDYENRSLWREYMPHALRLVQASRGCRMEERYNLYFWIGRCLRVDGRIREAVDCLERCCSWREATLDETHPDRLASEHCLARAYQDNGQVAKAVALLEKVVEIQAKTLDETHPTRLGSEHALAIAYRANGQVAEGVKLLETVVAIRKTTLAETHPDRLTSQHELARAYQANGQVDKASALLETVMAIRSTTLTETHPDRLKSQHMLAVAYLANGQVAEGVKLLETVVAIRGTMLADTHPDRLESQHALARAYLANPSYATAKEYQPQSRETQESCSTTNSYPPTDSYASFCDASTRPSAASRTSRAITSTMLSTTIMTAATTISSPTAESQSKDQPVLLEQSETAEGSDSETVFSVTSTTSDRRQPYLRHFADHLVRDAIEGSGIEGLSQIETGELNNMLREFGWRLHAEASTPFEWETSANLLQNRDEIIKTIEHVKQAGDRSDASTTANIRHDHSVSEVSSSKHEMDEEPQDATRPAFQDPNPNLTISSWMERVNAVGSSATIHEADGAETHENSLGESTSFLPQATLEVSVENCAASEDPEDTLFQLPAYKEFITESRAYQNLLCRIRQCRQLEDPDPGSRTIIRDQVLNLTRHLKAKISRREPQYFLHLKLAVGWNPFLVVNPLWLETGSFDFSSQVLCLSGSSIGKCQAASVADYLSQTWPTSGTVLLELVKELVSQPEGQLVSCQSVIQQARNCTTPQAQGARTITAQLENSLTTVFDIFGDVHFVADIVDQVGWLASAMRDSSHTGVAMCTPVMEIQRADFSSASGSRFEATGAINFSVVELDDNDGAGATTGLCWLPLFGRPLLVGGYPILRRPDDVSSGLEVSLQSVAFMIGGQYLTQFEDKIFLKSFGTMLVSSKVAEEDGICVWHLISSDTPDDRIAYTDPRVEETEFSMPDGLNLRALVGFRHIVGWCPKACDFSDQDPEKMSYSSSRLPNACSKSVLNRVYLEAGGPVIGGFSIDVRKKEKPVRLPWARTYFGLLNSIGRESIVFYDCGDSRAWLVDGYSAILRLVLVSLHHMKTDRQSPYKDDFELKYQDIKTIFEGCEGVFERSKKTLTYKQNLELPIFSAGDERLDFRAVVQDKLVIMEALTDWFQKRASEDGIKLSWKTLNPKESLVGFDLLDFITPDRLALPRVSKLDRATYSWTDLVSSARILTIFGHGFGSFIVPEDGTIICEDWAEVPMGKNYMAMTVSTLELLYENKLTSTRSLEPGELTGNLVWTSVLPSPCNACLRCQSGSAMSGPSRGDHVHDYHLQFLSGKTRTSLKGDKSPALEGTQDTQTHKPVNITKLGDKMGALVFSHKTILRQPTRTRIVTVMNESSPSGSEVARFASQTSTGSASRVAASTEGSGYDTTQAAATTPITSMSSQSQDAGEQDDQGGGGSSSTQMGHASRRKWNFLGKN